MAKYLLGVDGGNSKTDYMLFREDGAFVDILRRPTCSHERMTNSFDGAQEAMASHLNDLFTKNNITVNNIASAAFGLAGADLPEQIQALNTVIKNLGFTKYALGNDGILGVKAIAEAGVCAISGTGAVTVGINQDGKMLQVGGIGQVSGDYSGGSHITKMGVEAVYCHYYRMGGYSAIIPGILKLYGASGITNLLKLTADFTWRMENSKEINKIIDEAALSGDKIAAKILDDAGICSAEGVCGCIRNLGFEGEILVVMAGSVWHKLRYPGMIANFTDTIRRNTAQATRLVTLEATPALGAVFWAKELLHGPLDAKYRKEMLSFFNAEKYSELTR